MTYVLLIWFSVGVAPVERFDNSVACLKRLNALVPLYAKLTSREVADASRAN